MNNITAIQYVAEEGYTWVKKDNLEWLLGSIIYLSLQDNIENYEQVLIPEVESEKVVIE